jgi:hypothetical protein
MPTTAPLDRPPSKGVPMKHRVLFTSLFVLLPAALAAGCASKSDAEVMAELKQTLAASCKAGAAKSIGNLTPEATAKYCDCSAEKAAAMLGAERIRAIAGGESMSAADQQTVQQAGGACAVDMLKDMLTNKPAP